MIDVDKKSSGQLARFISWIKAKWVREVPDEIALCEFDCQMYNCREGGWGNCKRRMDYSAGDVGTGLPYKTGKA